MRVRPFFFKKDKKIKKKLASHSGYTEELSCTSFSFLRAIILLNQEVNLEF